MKKLYSIKDNLAGFGVADGIPAILDLPNDQIAIRMVKASCQKGASANYLNTFAENKEVWCVGEFDTETGKITPIEPYLVCKAIDYLEGDRHETKD